MDELKNYSNRSGVSIRTTISRDLMGNTEFMAKSLNATQAEGSRSIDGQMIGTPH